MKYSRVRRPSLGLLVALLSSQAVGAATSGSTEWGARVRSQRCDATFIKTLGQRAQSDNTDAIETLAFAYDRGCGVKADMRQAAALFTSAVALGDRNDMPRAYASYVTTGMPADSTAIELAERAERNGDCFAPYFLARIANLKVVRDVPEYRRQLKLGAACDDVDAIADLTADVTSQTQAPEAIRRLQAIDTPEATYDIAQINYRLLHDYQAAIPFVSRAMSHGVIASYTLRVLMALQRKDSETIAQHGVDWLTTAAHAVPNWRANDYLGYIYVQGFGVRQQVALGEKYYRPAADQGDDFAMNALGAIEVFGQYGAAVNVADGLRLLKRAVSLGNVVAKQNLAAYRWNLANAQSSDNDANAHNGYSDATDPNSPVYRLLHPDYQTMPAPGSPADPNRGPE